MPEVKTKVKASSATTVAAAAIVAVSAVAMVTAGGMLAVAAYLALQNQPQAQAPPRLVMPLADTSPEVFRLPYAPRSIIVKYKVPPVLRRRAAQLTTQFPTLNVLHIKYGVQNGKPVLVGGKDPTLYELTVDQAVDPAAAAKEFASDPNVAYAEPNYLFHFESVPNDPRYAEQWEHRVTQAEQGWSLEQGNPAVVIAVLDSGVNYDHEDLIDQMWRNALEAVGDTNGDGCPGACQTDDDLDGLVDEDATGCSRAGRNVRGEPCVYNNDLTGDDDENGYVDDLRGWDFVDIDVESYQRSGIVLSPEEDYVVADNNPSDYYGHGTAAASVAAAAGGNGKGGSGVCPSCTIMAVRNGGVSGAGGFAELDDIVNSIYYAVDNGADVINLSLSGPADARAVRTAIAYAEHRGVAVVAAAGNDATSRQQYPASYESVIAVAATNQTDGKADFSNFGNWVDVAAPGVGLLAADGLNDQVYRPFSGTSAAAPYVAGVVGLLRSRSPAWEPATLRWAVAAGVNRPQEQRYFIGHGRVNVRQTLEIETPPAGTVRLTVPAAGSFAYELQPIEGMSSGERYALSIGAGIYPSDWTVIGTGLGSSQSGAVRPLGTLNTKALPSGTYTIRLTDYTGAAVVQDAVRVAVDPRFRLFIPVTRFSALGHFVVDDIDGDHRQEMVLGSIGPTVFGYTMTGRPLAGNWPLQTNALTTVRAGVRVTHAVGNERIIVPTYGEGLDGSATLYAFDQSGNEVWSNSFGGSMYWMSCITLDDIGADGREEIMVVTMDRALRNYLRLVRLDGQEIWHTELNKRIWPLLGHSGSTYPRCPVSADVYGDSAREIILPLWDANEIEVGVYTALGQPVQRYPLPQFNLLSNFVVANDGREDTVLFTASMENYRQPTTRSTYYRLRKDGAGTALEELLRRDAADQFPLALGLGDITNDGKPELIAFERSSRRDQYGAPCLYREAVIAVYDLAGTTLATRRIFSPENCASMNPPVIADVNGDDYPEVMVMIQNFSRQQGELYALDGRDLATLDGFPIAIPSVDTFGLAFADVDGNGLPDILTLGESGIFRLELLPSFNPRKVEWPMFQRDRQGRARYDFVFSPPAISFRRGDANTDGVINISDPIYTLQWKYLGQGPEPSCLDALDTTDDGTIDTSDAIRTLNRLFIDINTVIPEPFNTIGADTTADSLNCLSYPPATAEVGGGASLSTQVNQEECTSIQQFNLQSLVPPCDSLLQPPLTPTPTPTPIPTFSPSPTPTPTPAITPYSYPSPSPSL